MIFASISINGDPSILSHQVYMACPFRARSILASSLLTFLTLQKPEIRLIDCVFSPEAALLCSSAQVAALLNVIKEQEPSRVALVSRRPQSGTSAATWAGEIFRIK